MKCKIIGSGGAIPTPRLFCECEICKKARTIGYPYKRNSSSFYIEDIKTLIDCPEDISDSLNKHNIKDVKNLFVTHWHPDHTFGLRVLLESKFSFIKNKAMDFINIYIGKNIYEMLKKKYPIVEYLISTQKTGKLHFIEDGDEIEIDNIKIECIGYKGKKSNNYGFLIKSNNKALLYTPCDTIDLDLKRLDTPDIWVTECGVFIESYNTELTFLEVIKRIKILKPRKTYLTHIEEGDLKTFGWKHLKYLKEKYPNLNFEFAEDGLEIKL